MHPDTNRSPSVGGAWVRLGRRQNEKGSCRDDVLIAIQSLAARTDRDTFKVTEVVREIVAVGGRYAESTVFKTMQRMKNESARPPYVQLERVGRDGFRLVH